MGVNRTCFVKLDILNGLRDDLHQTIKQFTAAVNYTTDHSEDVYKNGLLNRSIIYNEMYHDLWGKSDLPANPKPRGYSKAMKAIQSVVTDWGKGKIQLALNSRMLHVGKESVIYSHFEFGPGSTDKPTASVVGS